MSDYRRLYQPGATYFFTVVTAGRAKLFADVAACELLGRVTRACFERRPVDVIAMVLLPEHLHALWTLPRGDSDYSNRWRWIKREFTRAWLAAGGREQRRSVGKRRARARGIWQRRFWEHTIRDEADLEAHFDYIHYNPVKHGLVRAPRDWRWSSFHRWVRSGQYGIEWGRSYIAVDLPGNAGE